MQQTAKQQVPTAFKVPTTLMTQVIALLSEQPAKLVHNTLIELQSCQPLYDRGSVAPVDPGSTSGED